MSKVTITKDKDDIITLDYHCKIGLAYPDEVINSIGERLNNLLSRAAYRFKHGRHGVLTSTDGCNYFDRGELLNRHEVKERIMSHEIDSSGNCRVVVHFVDNSVHIYGENLSEAWATKMAYAIMESGCVVGNSPHVDYYPITQIKFIRVHGAKDWFEMTRKG